MDPEPNHASGTPSKRRAERTTEARQDKEIRKIERRIAAAAAEADADECEKQVRILKALVTTRSMTQDLTTRSYGRDAGQPGATPAARASTRFRLDPMPLATGKAHFEDPSGYFTLAVAKAKAAQVPMDTLHAHLAAAGPIDVLEFISQLDTPTKADVDKLRAAWASRFEIVPVATRLAELMDVQQGAREPMVTYERRVRKAAGLARVLLDKAGDRALVQVLRTSVNEKYRKASAKFNPTDEAVSPDDFLAAMRVHFVTKAHQHGNIHWDAEHGPTAATKHGATVTTKQGGAPAPRAPKRMRDAEADAEVPGQRGVNAGRATRGTRQPAALTKGQQCRNPTCVRGNVASSHRTIDCKYLKGDSAEEKREHARTLIRESDLCNRCGEKGHFARECSEPDTRHTAPVKEDKSCAMKMSRGVRVKERRKYYAVRAVHLRDRADADGKAAMAAVRARQRAHAATRATNNAKDGGALDSTQNAKDGSALDSAADATDGDPITTPGSADMDVDTDAGPSQEADIFLQKTLGAKQTGFIPKISHEPGEGNDAAIDASSTAIRRVVADVVFDGDVHARALLDSGADVDVVASTFALRHGMRMATMADLASSESKAKPVVLGVDDKPLRTHGQASPVTVTYNARRVRIQPIIIQLPADSGFDMIIGINSMHHFGVNLGGFVAGDAGDVAEGEAIERLRHIEERASGGSEADSDEARRSLADCFARNNALPPDTMCSHPLAMLKLSLSADPPFRASYPPSRAMAGKAREIIDEWLENGKIERCTEPTPFNSAITYTAKRNSEGVVTGVRACYDARALNSCLDPAEMDRYPMPTVDEVKSWAEGGTYYATLDVTWFYHSITLHPDSRKYCCFTFAGVQYRFKVAAFGIATAGHVAQRLIANILVPHASYARAFVDDIVIKTVGTLADHIAQVKAIIDDLTDVGLRINETKVHVAQRRVKLLGFIFGAGQTAVNVDKVNLWAKLPEPTTGGQLMAWAGFATFYAAHVPHFSALMAPLNKLRTTKSFVFSAPQRESYEAIRSILLEAPLLYHETPGAPYVITVDASFGGLGAALSQVVDGERRVIRFAGRSLKGAERRWPIPRLESAAIIHGLNAFHDHVFLRNFTIETDHRALSFLLKSSRINRFVANFMDILSGYNAEIVHRPGLSNDMILPDAISRLFPPSFTSFGGGWTSATSTDNEPNVSMDGKPERTAAMVAAIRTRTQRAAEHEAASRDRSQPPDAAGEHRASGTASPQSTTPAGDTPSAVGPQPRPAEPSDAEKLFIIDQHHAAIHQGAAATEARIRRKGHYWPAITEDVRRRIKLCVTCMRTNRRPRIFHELNSFMSSSPGRDVAFDLVGPLPRSDTGYQYILTAVDVSTRFVFLEPLVGRRTADVAQALFRIFSRYGAPDNLISDNAAEIRSEVMAELMAMFGIHQRFSRPRHSEGNGLVERFNGRAVMALRKRLENARTDWPHHLAAVEYVLNDTTVDGRTFTPFEATFLREDRLGAVRRQGAPGNSAESREETSAEVAERIRLAYQLLRPALDLEHEARAEGRKKRWADAKTISAPLVAGDVVVVENDTATKLEHPYQGPFIVDRRGRGGAYYLLDRAGEEVHGTFPPSQMRLIARADEAGEVFDDGDRVPPLASESDGTAYKFERIIAHRRSQRADASPTDMEYRVRWQGLPEAEDSWEPADMFTDARSVIQYWRSAERNGGASLGEASLSSRGAEASCTPLA